jgi:hypothetical protein
VEDEVNPLFAAIQDHEATLDAIQSFVEANPSLAPVRQRSFQGSLSIHEAVEEVLPGVVRYLLKVWTESVKENTDFRNFIAPPPPSTSPPKGAASAVLVVAPFTRRRRQQPPQKQWTVAISVTKAEKNGAGTLPKTPRQWRFYGFSSVCGRPYEVTGLGNLPLHLACCHNAPLQEVRYLGEGYPPAVRATGACGVLPLHLASGSHHPEPLPAPRRQVPCRALPRVDPRVLLKDGGVALLEAIHWHAKDSVLGFFLETWPEAALEGLDDGDRCTVHGARRCTWP